MSDPKYHVGDLVRLNEKGFDWWGHDEQTFHLADNSFEVLQYRPDPKRGALYTLSNFPFPVPEDELMSEEEYDLAFGADDE
jgi:hypothetical protein